jgi:class I fructose-bisphosphate aldolase
MHVAGSLSLGVALVNLRRVWARSLWTYLRNSKFTTAEKDYHVAADLTGQANRLGVMIQEDIIKQKLPENNSGCNELKLGKTSPLMYEKLTTDHPSVLWQRGSNSCRRFRACIWIHSWRSRN